ncbi:uncharacterized protein ATNIH1004_005277 [Aspergillus tanneri]|uniref:Uncharacterized protein n=1 Tax=Aspergillus tanneri TaxID=1220188 RepID=A0A5M9MTU3_9EURO|nr:uncharacterized protein ATNIH1004_005277 [Aspergillus tanneri]KAA8649376.1 hypothetical protein ATNIH1004_005277 [Aspergillus tanneri]
MILDFLKAGDSENAFQESSMLTRSAYRSMITFEIDYFGLQLLAALMDKERVGALSQSFLRGAQSWTRVVFVPTKGLGVFDGYDMIEDLRRRNPDLVVHVTYDRCMFRRGDHILLLADGSWPYVAWSRTSRYYAVEVWAKINTSISYNVTK